MERSSLINHCVYKSLTDRTVACVFVLESGDEVVGIYVSDKAIGGVEFPHAHNLMLLNEAYRRARAHAEDILEKKRRYDDITDIEGVIRYAE